MSLVDKLGLLELDDLLKLRAPATRKSGIYILFDGDEVVYVGKSMDVPSRLGQHLSKESYIMRFGGFDSYVYIEASRELDLLEIAYITKFRPKFNKQQTGKWGTFHNEAPEKEAPEE